MADTNHSIHWPHLESLPNFVIAANDRPGVYAFICKIDGRIYVGSSRDIRKRLAVHLSSLRRGRSSHCYLQDAWTQHGEGSFEWGVLEFCRKKILIEREQFYIDITMSYDRANGFNARRLATNSIDPRNNPRGPNRSLSQAVAERNMIWLGAVEHGFFDPLSGKTKTLTRLELAQIFRVSVEAVRQGLKTARLQRKKLREFVEESTPDWV